MPSQRKSARHLSRLGINNRLLNRENACVNLVICHSTLLLTHLLSTREFPKRHLLFQPRIAQKIKGRNMDFQPKIAQSLKNARQI